MNHAFAIFLVLVALPTICSASTSAPDSEVGKDIEMVLKVAGCAGTLFGVGFAIYKGLDELRRTRNQRAEELAVRVREYRHKQALYARSLIGEVFAIPRAAQALHMLDWLEDEYQDSDGKKYVVRRANLQHALRVYKDGGFTDEEWFVRNCFEALYNQLEQIERMIILEIVRFEDLETAFRYYMRHAQRPDIIHLEFLDAYDYPQAKAFVLRFPDGIREPTATRGPLGERGAGSRK